MRLREALDLCTDAHAGDWVTIPGNRPATTMLGGLFDPGEQEPRVRPLQGHTIAVYEPDPRLSMVWPVPDEDEVPEVRRERVLPEWLEADTRDWKSARPGFVVICVAGSPIWQTAVWYLDWGSGIGGYVSDIEPVFSEDASQTGDIAGWTTTAWAAGLARLINAFSPVGGFRDFDPTGEIVPKPAQIHPVDAQQAGM